MIAHKGNYTRDELLRILDIFLDYITLVPFETFASHLDKAAAVMIPIDPDDAVFAACALALDGIIWSDDRDFERQKLADVVKTADLVRLFMGESF